MVSAAQLTDGRAILAALSARSKPALVVEGTRSELARKSDAIGSAVEPTLPQQIVEAVERARSTG